MHGLRLLSALLCSLVLLASCGSDDPSDTASPTDDAENTADTGDGSTGDDAQEEATAGPEATATDVPEAPTSTPEPELPGLAGRYVAMGSSFAAGVGAGPDVTDGVCVQGAENYPRLVAAALDLDLVDVSCNAATINNVVDTAQGDVPPQIEAITPDTSLVTVTVGGNDVGYILNFLTCGNGCSDATVDSDEARAERFAALTDELTEMLTTVGGEAPEARLLLVAYPVIVESAEGSCEGIQDQDLAFQYDMGLRLQQAFVDAAEAAGVEFVDAYGNSFGHGACVPVEERWMDGATPTTAAFPWHPNATGHQAMAELVVASLLAG